MVINLNKGIVNGLIVFIASTQSLFISSYLLSSNIPIRSKRCVFGIPNLLLLSIYLFFNLSSAISQYSLLISNPIKFLLFNFADKHVVPLPQNMSKIKSPSLDELRINLLVYSKGF